MARLAPPIVEGTIPAFYQSDDGAYILKVPFSMNRGVSYANVSGIKLKIKTITSSTYLGTFDNIESDTVFSNEQCYACFDLSAISNKLNAGQFYKIQLAYVSTSDDEIGYYSAVSTVKFTTKPSVYIEGLSASGINDSSNQFIGVYSQDVNGDVSEKIYKYSFIIYSNMDSQPTVFYSTDYLVHNSLEDTELNQSIDILNLNYTFNESIVYGIQYHTISINGLELSSSIYKFQATSYQDDNTLTLDSETDYDNGCININISPRSAAGVSINSSYDLYRSKQNIITNNFELWEKVATDTLADINLTTGTKLNIFKDYTVEHGCYYKYKLQYDDKICVGEPVYSDFEACFLYDGIKQLKISFNTQINSFKNDVLEQKIDTIGSKHPFFFRNGNVLYKELSISGLVSYLSDNEQLFMTNKELGLVELDQVRTSSNLNAELLSANVRTTELVSYNFAAERAFKLDVLNWVTNGEIKLFRSPAEGNYLVRLMNSSMAPNAQLGRLVHTLTCTAYEYDECTYENLVKYHILNFDN